MNIFERIKMWWNKPPRYLVKKEEVANYTVVASRQSFSSAFNHIRTVPNSGIRLSDWGIHTTLRVQYPDQHSKMNDAYIYAENNGNCIPWTLSHNQLFSKKWELVEECK